jgi:CTP synthase
VDEATPHPVVHMMPGQRSVTQKGGTMRLGAYECILVEDSLVARLYSKRRISERHRHRYEVNNAYREILARNGLGLSGVSPDGSLVEIVELSSHPFFVASQFHPEFKSRPLECHPMFKGFIKAALQHKHQAGQTPLLSAVSR